MMSIYSNAEDYIAAMRLVHFLFQLLLNEQEPDYYAVYEAFNL